jgi:hypothetical protein
MKRLPSAIPADRLHASGDIPAPDANHLHRIFPKLGIISHTQLHAAVLGLTGRPV